MIFVSIITHQDRALNVYVNFIMCFSKLAVSITLPVENEIFPNIMNNILFIQRFKLHSANAYTNVVFPRCNFIVIFYMLLIFRVKFYWRMHTYFHAYFLHLNAIPRTLNFCKN